jgi:hypothetical protein
MAIRALDGQDVGKCVTEICETEEWNPRRGCNQENIGEGSGSSDDQVLKWSALFTDRVETLIPLHSYILDSKAKKQRRKQMSALMQQHRNDAKAEAMDKREKPSNNSHPDSREGLDSSSLIRGGIRRR